jgi:hypothetical protein
VKEAMEEKLPDLQTPVSEVRRRPGLVTLKSGSSEYLRAGVCASADVLQSPTAITSESATAATDEPFGTSLATLLAAHVLRDGEIILLILKPSLWFILLSSLRFIAVGLMFIIAAKVFDPQLPGRFRGYAELGVSVISGRLIWATMQWMSRLYILTDLRILSLWGVFNIEVFDCPLRKVARTRLVRHMLERLVGVGSIEIIPQDESSSFGLWQTIPHPKRVREQIIATINRAKQGGLP